MPLMLLALFAMGVHSTFFGPIKYAILPQHLERDEVLGGTGLVEAGTYIAILGGTLLAGVDPGRSRPRPASSLIALLGYVTGRQVPPAPPLESGQPIDLNIVRSSIRLVNATLHIPRLFLAIVAISFFWTIGAVLFIQFPPLVKNVLTADQVGRQPVHRHLLGRDRDRLGGGQPAAQGRGVGALRDSRRCW